MHPSSVDPTPEAPAARHPVRNAVLAVVTSVAIALATLLVLEGAASAALFVHDFRHPNAPRANAQKSATHDTLLGWVGRPGYANPDEYGHGIGLSTDAAGLRLTDAQAAPGPVTLLCAGDSFTMGVGVADGRQWCSLLGGFFGGMRTADMGQAGYGVDQAYLWYRRDGATVPHRVLLLALTDVQFDRALTDDYAGLFKPVFALAADTLALHNVPVPVQTSAALQHAAAMRTIEALRLMQVIRTIPAFDARRDAERRVEARWRMFERLFDDFAALDRRRGSTLVLAYLPTQRDLHPGPLDARRDSLAAYARARNIPFIDLTPALRALRPDSLDLAFITKVPPGAPGVLAGHYSDLGNAWAARALASWLAGVAALQPLLHAAPGHGPT